MRQTEDKRNFAFCGIPFCGIKQGFWHATKGWLHLIRHPSDATFPIQGEGLVFAFLLKNK